MHTLKITLYGSLAATGKGHATPEAILMGLEGDDPEKIETSTINARYEAMRTEKRLSLGGVQAIHYDMDRDMVSLPAENSDLWRLERKERAERLTGRTRRIGSLQLWKMEALPTHPNGMRFAVFDENGRSLPQ